MLSRLPLRRAARWALAAALLGAAPATAVCVGDCNGDGRVSIAELQACVNRGSNLPGYLPGRRSGQRRHGRAQRGRPLRPRFLDPAACAMVFTPVPTNTVAKTNTPVPTNTPAPTATRTNTVGPSNTPTRTVTRPRRPPPKGRSARTCVR
ncbi:MAG: hypothetical protein U0802_10135 [Candidatus Binatia bacterium]